MFIKLTESNGSKVLIDYDRIIMISGADSENPDTHEKTKSNVLMSFSNEPSILPVREKIERIELIIESAMKEDESTQTESSGAVNLLSKASSAWSLYKIASGPGRFLRMITGKK